MIFSHKQLKGKIRVGDKVKRAKGKPCACNEIDKGSIQKITKVTHSGFEINYCDHSFENTDYYVDLIDYKKGQKPKPVNFLLQYALDEDPIEEFSTMKEVEERIKELAEDEDLQRDSLVIYEIKSKKTVVIETKITIS